MNDYTKLIAELDSGCNDGADLPDVLHRAARALEAAGQRITELEAAQPPCDGGCDYNNGPEETCSQHGRPVAEVWGIVQSIAAERDPLAARVTELEAERISADNLIRATLEALGSGPHADPIIKAREVVAERDRLRDAIREALDFQAVLPAIATRPREILTKALEATS